MTLEAVQWYQSEIVALGMILIGLFWLILNKMIFVPIERVTVRRWGRFRHEASTRPWPWQRDTCSY